MHLCSSIFSFPWFQLCCFAILTSIALSGPALKNSACQAWKDWCPAGHEQPSRKTEKLWAGVKCGVPEKICCFSIRVGKAEQGPEPTSPCSTTVLPGGESEEASAERLAPLSGEPGFSGMSPAGSLKFFWGYQVAETYILHINSNSNSECIGRHWGDSMSLWSKASFKNLTCATTGLGWQSKGQRKYLVGIIDIPMGERVRLLTLFTAFCKGK